MRPPYGGRFCAYFITSQHFMDSIFCRSPGASLSLIHIWELRARGIEHLRVVYSTEPPRTPKNRTAAPAPGQPLSLIHI